MKMTTFAAVLLPLMLVSVSGKARASIIEFDFLDLIENQIANIDGRLSDGSDYSGAPLATSYEYFNWNKEGVNVAVTTQHEQPDEFGDGSGNYDPAFVYLQPGFAGLGTCQQADCAQASKLDYFDRIRFDFSDVVEIIKVEFSVGEDDSNRPPDYEDYRGYDGRLVATGGPNGVMRDLKGSRYDWNGSLFGNALEFSHPEGGRAFIESITIRTADVAEPATWGLLLLGMLALGLSRRQVGRSPRLHIGLPG